MTATDWVNIAGWALHFLVVLYAFPFLRATFRGCDWVEVVYWGSPRFPWFVAACVPIVSWPFLVGRGITYRWEQQEAEANRISAAKTYRRLKDVKYWRDKLTTGSPGEQALAHDLLEMWGQPIALPEVEPVDRMAHGLPDRYFHGCRCVPCCRAWSASAYERHRAGMYGGHVEHGHR